eukprot:gnl/Chilomastix_cuspidata/4274.p1 GENE.gnl/Chilomastix_cuspidata/4274~~gnl/Chilomastix_cuspidata/4274.p1  ORF type:complete len:579 (-),score=262.41 gnl/Chilomastix_cuspidata/4274:9-1745(-)
MSAHLSFEDIGATEFLLDLPAFAGAVKARFEDFIVEEIALDGTLCVPIDATDPDAATTAHFLELREKKSPLSADAAAAPPLPEALGAVLGDELPAFAAWLADANSPPFRTRAIADKDARTALHVALRQVGGVSSQTDSTNAGTLNTVVVRRGRGEQRSRKWPRGRPRFTQFTLRKAQKDTQFAVQRLAKCMPAWNRVPPARFSFAGTKDRRGVTAQAVTARQAFPSALLQAAARADVEVGNFRFVDAPLALGDLSGNRFTLVVRGIPQADFSAAETRAERLGLVPNFFGAQRFGTMEPRTHEVGVALLKQDWQRGLDMILAPHAADPDPVARAKRLYLDQRDAATALAELRKCSNRGAAAQPWRLLTRLQKHGEGTSGAALVALKGLPRTMRLMYVHAVQSYVFNAAASARVRRFREHPAVEPGDLVLGAGGEPRLIDSDAEAAAHSAEDIVLPLVSATTALPGGRVAGAITDALERLGLTLEDFARNRQSDFSPAGSYRAAFIRPADVAATFASHAEFADPLDAAAAGPPAHGGFCSLRISFSLPSSSYATVVLRELMGRAANDVSEAAARWPAPDE